ncbi:tetratricopeptide repeat protein [bacterium]|nr:MAG: tetratricopeptide repeat protein [bacterium]
MTYAKWLAVITLVSLALIPVPCLSGCGFSETEQEYQQHFVQGNAYLDQEQWDEAIAEYTKAIELNPEFADAYASRAVAYYEKYKQRLEAGCDWQGGSLVNDCDRALELDPSIQLDPRLANAYVQLGNCYLEWGVEWGNWEPDKAIAYYTRAMEIDPTITIASNVKPELAEAYYRRGHRELEYLDAYKHDYDQGLRPVSDRIDRYSKAVADYIRAMELDPTISPWLNSWLASAYYGRGIQYSMCGETDKAAADFAKAVELAPDEAEFHQSQLAEAYYSRGMNHHKYWNPDEAISDYTKAIEINPTNGNYYYSRGDVYYVLADYYWDAGQVSKEVDSYNKAIADFTRAIELGIESARIYNYRGNCYGAIDDYDKAIADYSSAIELDYPDIDAVYYCNRANAYKKLGNKEKALIDYRKALALSSEGIWSEDDWLKEQILKDMRELQSD